MTLLAAINWHTFFFAFFALLTCGFALAVLFTSNIVRMAFYLTLSLGSASGLFFLAGSEFIGAMQFMIYVGGTLVLLIFGVMLTAQQRFISMETAASEWILAAIVGSALLLLLVRSGFSVQDWNQARNPQEIAVADGKTSGPIGLALTGVRVDKLDEPNAALRQGKSGYLLPFVIVSMHLLVVLIGAGYMARTKRRSGAGAVGIAGRTAAPRADRKFPWTVSAGIIQGWIVNLLLAVVCFTGVLRGASAEVAADASGWQKLQAWFAALPVWLLPTLGLLFVLGAFLLWVVYSWQQWGVVGLFFVPLAQAFALHNAGVGPLIVTVFALAAIAPVIALTVLLCSGRPTLWSRMD